MRPDDLIHFCPPGRLIIGCGVRAQLPELMRSLGYRCGVIVTDRFFTQHTPWVQEYVEAAEALGMTISIFDGGLPDPTTTLCDDATSQILAALGQDAADHVIALGGGSNIDLGKALCLTLPSGRPVRDFVAGIGEVRPLPLIALPTTSGTGSEATPGAILIDPSNAIKVAVMDNALRPQVAMIDPQLTYTCPPRVTADAGIDAFTHAIESLLTVDSNEYDRGGNADPGYSGRSSLTMMFAREAVRLCAQYLERAYVDGSDTEARIGMSYASIYAALSYGSAGLNAVHGIAYAVAGQTHRSHGSTNAVMLPYVLDALREVRSTELLDVATIFGISAGSAAETVSAVPVAVRRLVARLGIPTDLAQFGVEKSALPALTADALAVSRLAKAFPLQDTAGQYRAIVENAFNGRLSGTEEAALARATVKAA